MARKTALDTLSEFVPKLSQLGNDVGYGDVWERPELSKRDRSLCTIAALIAMGRERQMTGHFDRALNNGLSEDELKEVITQLALYSGWPTAMTAAAVFKEVVASRGN